MFFLQLSKFIMTSRFRRFMTQRLCSALRVLGLVYGCCSGCWDGRAVSGEGLYRCSCCVPVVTSSMTTLGNALRTLDQCILEKKMKSSIWSCKKIQIGFWYDIFYDKCLHAKRFDCECFYYILYFIIDNL